MSTFRNCAETVTLFVAAPAAKPRPEPGLVPPPLFRRVGAQSVLHFLLPKICVVTVAELLAGFGSKLDELTTAVFVIDSLFADPEIFTVMVMVAVAPLAMFPKLQ